MRRWGALAAPFGLGLYLLRSVAGAGGSASSLAGSWDPDGTWSLPVSAAAALLPGGWRGLAGLALTALAVLGTGWAAGRLAGLAGAGERMRVFAGLLPGLLLPVAAPAGRLAPILLAAFALAGLAGALADHLQRQGGVILLEVMLWSQLLALCSPDWIWVALAFSAGLVPLLAGRGRGRIEAPLAVLVAGGAWAAILRALVEGGLQISDRPPGTELGGAAQALLGISAALVLVLALVLLVTGRSAYGLTITLAVPGLVALIDVAVRGISAPAGLAVFAVLPAFLVLVLRARSDPSGDLVRLRSGP